MKNILILILVSSISLFAYSDSDVDGVEDRLDMCPNTIITDLVDMNGCTKVSLVSNHHFDIVLGASYGLSDNNLISQTDTYATTFQVDYYYKRFSMQVATSYFETTSDSYSEESLGDTTVALYYAFYPTDSLSLKIGGGAILPTYSDSLGSNEVDYLASLNVGYMIDSVSVFMGYNFSIINDEDTVDVTYQDTSAYNFGVGYSFNPNLYSNISYFQSDSVFEGVEDIQSASAYIFYSLSEKVFTSFTYSKGLSDSASDHYLSAKVGYYF